MSTTEFKVQINNNIVDKIIKNQIYGKFMDNSNPDFNYYKNVTKTMAESWVHENFPGLELKDVEALIKKNYPEYSL